MTFLGIFLYFSVNFSVNFSVGVWAGPGVRAGGLEVGAQRAPRLLVFNNQIKLSFMFRFSSLACHVAGLTSPSAYTHTGEENAFDQK